MVRKSLGTVDRLILEELIRRARKAKMTPYAYAVHTGNSYAVKLTAEHRARTDHAHCTEILAQAVIDKGHEYITLCVQHRLSYTPTR